MRISKLNFRFVLITAGIFFLLAGAGTKSFAQTPEAIIRQCPALPAVKQLVNGLDTRASGPEVEAFQAKVETLRKDIESIMEAGEEAVNAAGEQDADRVAKQFTGHSAAELDNMSDDEQEAMVNNMLSSMGMNMTLSQIEALDGKSDEEIMAVLLKSGTKTGKESTVDMLKLGESGATIVQAATELQAISERWAEIAGQMRLESEEATQQIVAIDRKYAPKVAAIKPTKWISGEDAGYTFTDAELKAREDLFIACRTEQYTLWRNHAVKMQERIKTIMTDDVPRYDELMKQQLTASGMTASAPLTLSMGYGFAIEYLSWASNVTILPEISIGDMERVEN